MELENVMTMAIKNSFRATGLYPSSADAVNYSKCKLHINDVSMETACNKAPITTQLNTSVEEF